MKALFVAFALVSCAGYALANVANFDTFTEGFSTSYTDGGITFSALDCYLGDGPHDSFAIDDASADLASQPGFSSPNVLGFNGYSPGTGVAFTRLGTFDFTTGATASGASFDFYSFGADAGTAVTLQGLLNGNVVNSVTVNLPTQFTIQHSSVVLGAGTYDSFRVVSSSPTNQGASFGVIDNVNVTPVPEPATLAVFGIGALILRRKQK